MRFGVMSVMSGLLYVVCGVMACPLGASEARGALPSLTANGTLGAPIDGDSVTDWEIHLSRAFEQQVSGWQANGGLEAALVWYVARWIKVDPVRGVPVISDKYYAFAIQNWEAVRRIADALRRHGVPSAAIERWNRYYGQRLVAWRMLIDVPGVIRHIRAMPLGEAVENVDSVAFMAEVEQRYADLLGDGSGAARWRVLSSLAEYNPDLHPPRFYRLPADAEVAESAPHAVVPLTDGRQHVAVFDLEPNAVGFFPSADDLAQRMRGRPVPSGDEDAAVAPLRRFAVTVAEGIGRGRDLKLSLVVDQETVVGGWALLGEDDLAVASLIPAPEVIRSAPRRGRQSAGDSNLDMGLDLGSSGDYRRRERVAVREEETLAQQKPATSGGFDWLSWDGETIHGRARIVAGGKRDRQEIALLVDLQIRDGTVTGQIDVNRLTCPANGREVVAPSGDPVRADWPMVHGPLGTGHAVPSPPLVEDFAEAQVAWVSDRVIPNGRGQDVRGGVKDVPSGMPTMGGWASPVVADGAVVVSYYEPSGEHYTHGAQERVTPETAERFRLNRVLADDVVHCFDAATGETRWIRRFPQSGTSWASFNKNGPQLSPAIVDGRVYAMGTTGLVWCLDLATGAVIWQHDIGLRREQMDHRSGHGIAEAVHAGGGRNDFQSNVIVAQGVVVVSDHRRSKTAYRYESPNGLIGLDAATGRQLWHQPEVAGVNKSLQGAQRWVHDGQSWILASGLEQVSLIDPRDGRIIDQCELEVRTTALGVGRRVVIGEMPVGEPDAEGNRARQITAFRVSPDGFSERPLWQLPPEVVGMSGGALVMDGVAWLQTRTPAQLLAVSEADGEILAGAGLEAVGGEHCPFVLGGGGLVIAPKERTQGVQLWVADPDEADASWLQYPAGMATGYCGPLYWSLADGRLFVRWPTRLVAYDLRR